MIDIIYSFRMAFVFREERKTDLHKSPTDLGPGFSCLNQAHINSTFKKKTNYPKPLFPLELYNQE